MGCNKTELRLTRFDVGRDLNAKERASHWLVDLLPNSVGRDCIYCKPRVAYSPGFATPGDLVTFIVQFYVGNDK